MFKINVTVPMHNAEHDELKALANETEYRGKVATYIRAMIRFMKKHPDVYESFIESQTNGSF